MCPPDEECPCAAPQRKGFILPGIWRHLEKCRGDFLGGGDGRLKAFIRPDRGRTGLPKLLLILFDSDRLAFVQHQITSGLEGIDFVMPLNLLMNNRTFFISKKGELQGMPLNESYNIILFG